MEYPIVLLKGVAAVGVTVTNWYLIVNAPTRLHDFHLIDVWHLFTSNLNKVRKGKNYWFRQDVLMYLRLEID